MKCFQSTQSHPLRDQLEQQKNASQDQIKQSEQNLADHYKNLIQQQQVYLLLFFFVDP